MNFEEKRKRILEIQAEMRALDEEKIRLIVELQQECSHKKVVGATYPSRRLDEVDGHRTICLICGLKEGNIRGDSEFKRLESMPARKISHFDFSRKFCRSYVCEENPLLPMEEVEKF